MTKTSETPSSAQPHQLRRMCAWLAGLQHDGRPRLFLAGALLFVTCAGAAAVAAGKVEQHRRVLPRSDHGSPVAVAADAAVIGLALEAGQVPPGLEPGEQVVVLDTGSDSGPPLVDMARVTTLAGDASVVRVGLEVPARAAGTVAAAGANDRLALAKLPMA